MREKWAKLVVVFTGLVVVLLAYMFADSQNPVERSIGIEPKASAQDFSRIETGRQIYMQQMCARCHSIAGEGNPRNPLDGVGSRRTTEELRDWILGAYVLKGKLSPRVIGTKQSYRKLSAEELNALVFYLQSRQAK